MATETKTPLGQVMNGRGWMRPACTCLKPLLLAFQTLTSAPRQNVKQASRRQAVPDGLTGSLKRPPALSRPVADARLSAVADASGRRIPV